MITLTEIPLPVVRRLRQGDSGETCWHYAHMTNLTASAPDPRRVVPDIPNNAHTEMAESAAEASAYLKSLAHEGRLMILCHLSAQERSVGELETLLDLRQSAVSQMLARLREDGLVKNRRDGKTIYYSLANSNTQQVIGLLYALFCGPDDAA